MEKLQPYLKFITTIAIWLIAGLFSIIQVFLVPVEGAFNLIMMIILFGMATIATSLVFYYSHESEKNQAKAHQAREQNEYSQSSTGKRKNEQAGGPSSDMLALLSEDDLEELRERVKNRLIDRIEGGGDGELSSLDALLADQDAPRKNRR